MRELQHQQWRSGIGGIHHALGQLDRIAHTRAAALVKHFAQPVCNAVELSLQMRIHPLSSTLYGLGQQNIHTIDQGVERRCG